LWFSLSHVFEHVHDFFFQKKIDIFKKKTYAHEDVFVFRFWICFRFII
jgi:hypothetical protein